MARNLIGLFTVVSLWLNLGRWYRAQGATRTGVALIC